jgi:DNA-binding MurR/RpiR family transcriptional regulator
VSTGEKFSRRQEQAIAYLLAEPTIEKAAKACGIGEATLRRWLKDAGFQERYRAARKRSLETALNRLQQIAGEAIETLRAVAVDQQAPPSSRVAAARVVLETIIKTVELQEIEERLNELEKSASAIGRKRR